LIGDWESKNEGEGIEAQRGARRNKAAAEASFMAVGVGVVKPEDLRVANWQARVEEQRSQQEQELMVRLGRVGEGEKKAAA
jgi:hypothetical protein